MMQGLVTRVGAYKAKALSHVTIIGTHARLSEARVLDSCIGPYAGGPLNYETQLKKTTSDTPCPCMHPQADLSKRRQFS